MRGEEERGSTDLGVLRYGLGMKMKVASRGKSWTGLISVQWSTAIWIEVGSCPTGTPSAGLLSWSSYGLRQPLGSDRRCLTLWSRRTTFREDEDFVEFKAQTCEWPFVLLLLTWTNLTLRNLFYFIRLLELFKSKETAIKLNGHRGGLSETSASSRLFAWLTPDNLLCHIYRHTCLTLTHIHVRLHSELFPGLLLSSISRPHPSNPNTQSYAFYKATV